MYTLLFLIILNYFELSFLTCYINSYMFIHNLLSRLYHSQKMMHNYLSISNAYSMLNSYNPVQYFFSDFEMSLSSDSEILLFSLNFVIHHLFITFIHDQVLLNVE